MDEKTFPFRLDARTSAFIADLIGIMQNHDLRLSSRAGAVTIQFLNKGTQSGTIDSEIAFTPNGVQMNLSMNAVAKNNPASATWLRQYHAFISRNRQLTPVPSRCSVTVEGRVDGQLKYYLTYMVAHEDGSLAQDMPQGRLYHTTALGSAQPVHQPPQPAAAAGASPGVLAEPASWLIGDDTD